MLSKGVAKLGNIVADANVSQFSRAGNICWEKKILLFGKKKFLAGPGVKNIFASRTQILRPKHRLPSLAKMKTMLISFQCRSLLGTVSVLTTIKMADCEEIEAGHPQKRKGKRRELER